MYAHWTLSVFIAISVTFVSGAARAQINEADRQNRCQNNREALARLTPMLQADDWTDAQWATVLEAARLIAQADFELESQLRATRQLIDSRNDIALSGSDYARRDLPQLDEQIKAATQRYSAITQRKLDVGAAIGLNCSLNYPCERDMAATLNNAINRQQPRRAQVAEIRRQIANHQTNLIALRCDQAGYSIGPATLADPYGTRWSESESGWSGDWVRRGKTNVYDASWNGGVVKAILTITINGNSVQVSRQNATDANNCQYQGTLNGNTVTGKYSCTSGGGDWRATIQ
jgi:hypothetical protein